jgi:hypothetical protein
MAHYILTIVITFIRIYTFSARTRVKCIFGYSFSAAFSHIFLAINTNQLNSETGNLHLCNVQHVKPDKTLSSVQMHSTDLKQRETLHMT